MTTTTVLWRAVHSPPPARSAVVADTAGVHLLAFVNHGTQAVTPPKIEEASDVDTAGKKFKTTTATASPEADFNTAQNILGVRNLPRKLTHFGTHSGPLSVP